MPRGCRWPGTGRSRCGRSWPTTRSRGPIGAPARLELGGAATPREPRSGRRRDRGGVPRGARGGAGDADPTCRRLPAGGGRRAGRVRRRGQHVAARRRPGQPGAWLTVAARRRAIDRMRRNRSVADRADRLAELMRLERQEHRDEDEDSAIVDDRLRLIFTCCHPALDSAGAGGVDAARPRRADDRRDRARVPGRGADDGQADRPRQAQDRRRADPVSRARRRGAARPAARRSAGAVSDLQRGLLGDRGRAAGAGRAVRRGDPPRAAAVRADARRGRGLGATGADAPARRSSRCARGA